MLAGGGSAAGAAKRSPFQAIPLTTGHDQESNNSYDPDPYAGKVTPRISAINGYYEALQEAGEDPELLREVKRILCREDLFFLLVYIFGREDVNNDWLFDRCMEIQDQPDGYLDLWARGHYKSTIITYAKTIQDILINPNETTAIFSHTKGIARAFLRQIKYELETNDELKALFPEILYQEPKKQSPVWSLDQGIVVKRKSNPKEATVEAHGLVDGQPTSRHYDKIIYDDVVTLESVSTPEMMKKTTDAWRLSLNLGATSGDTIIRMIGTRYHANDTWGTIIKQRSARPRLYPATDTGKPDGKPVFLSAKMLAEKRRDMGAYVFAAQMLQDPTADEAQGFSRSDMRYYITPPPMQSTNRYILVDPASSKKKESDYTVLFVVGLGIDGNYYVYDIVRDRLNLRERGRLVMSKVREWEVESVGYEQYGMMADIEYIEELMDRESYRFSIIPLGGKMAKEDRIRRLIPVFEQHKVYFPHVLMYRGYDGVERNMIKVFIEEELEMFPVSTHDDMLDALARIKDADLRPVWPKKKKERKKNTVAERLKKVSRARTSNTVC